jgi:hypothetical protein
MRLAVYLPLFFPPLAALAAGRSPCVRSRAWPPGS